MIAKKAPKRSYAISILLWVMAVGYFILAVSVAIWDVRMTETQGIALSLSTAGVLALCGIYAMFYAKRAENSVVRVVNQAISQIEEEKP